MLQVYDTIRLQGFVKLYSETPQGRILVASNHNLVTINGRAYVARLMAGEETDVGVQYLAIGNGTSTPAQTDVQLENEHVRNEPTEIFSNGLIDILAYTFYTGSQANIHIREVGVFVSPASEERGTGVMFARSLINFDNSGLAPTDLTLEWRIRVI